MSEKFYDDRDEIMCLSRMNKYREAITEKNELINDDCADHASPMRLAHN